jgi:hypothetical protein
MPDGDQEHGHDQEQAELDNEPDDSTRGDTPSLEDVGHGHDHPDEHGHSLAPPSTSSNAAARGNAPGKRKKKEEEIIVDPEAGIVSSPVQWLGSTDRCYPSITGSFDARYSFSVGKVEAERRMTRYLPVVRPSSLIHAVVFHSLIETAPSGARDVQRAFRARRAAHLAKLEDRILELEAENNRLRAQMGLNLLGRDDLGSGPTGRGKSLKEGGVPMAERVKAKKERDRLRAQQAAREKGILPPSNEEVDKAHGHELIGDDFDDDSSRRTMTMTPESPASLQLGRSPSFSLPTPGTSVHPGTPHLSESGASSSILGLQKQTFPSGLQGPPASQVQAELHKLYTQAYLASVANTAQQGWNNPMTQANGYNSNSPSINVQPPPPNLPDLIALLTGINQTQQRQNNTNTQQSGNAFSEPNQAGMSNMSLPMPFPGNNAPSFPSIPNNSVNNTGSNNNRAGSNVQNYAGPSSFPDISPSASNSPFDNYSYNPPGSSSNNPSPFVSFPMHPPSNSANHRLNPSQNNHPQGSQHQPNRPSNLGIRSVSFGTGARGSRSPGDMGPPPIPSVSSAPPSRSQSATGHAPGSYETADRGPKPKSDHPAPVPQGKQKQQGKKEEPGGTEPDLLHRLRHCCHLTDHHVATDPGLLLFASRLCLAVGCPFGGNHVEPEGTERGENGGGKRRKVESSGHDDESEDPEGYMKLEAAWLALRSHLDPSPSDANPILGIPGLSGGERDGQNEIATGRLAAEMVLRGARSKMQASQQGGTNGMTGSEGTLLAYWIGCRRKSGLVIEKGLVDVITMAF